MIRAEHCSRLTYEELNNILMNSGINIETDNYKTRIRQIQDVLQRYLAYANVPKNTAHTLWNMRRVRRQYTFALPPQTEEPTKIGESRNTQNERPNKIIASRQLGNEYSMENRALLSYDLKRTSESEVNTKSQSIERQKMAKQLGNFWSKINFSDRLEIGMNSHESFVKEQKHKCRYYDNHWSQPNKKTLKMCKKHSNDNFIKTSNIESALLTPRKPEYLYKITENDKKKSHFTEIKSSSIVVPVNCNVTGLVSIRANDNCNIKLKEQISSAKIEFRKELLLNDHVQEIGVNKINYNLQEHPPSEDQEFLKETRRLLNTLILQVNGDGDRVSLKENAKEDLVKVAILDNYFELRKMTNIKAV